MTNTTKNTTTKNTTSAGTAVRPVQRGHQVAVQFSAHGVQRVDARAHASGGRGDQLAVSTRSGPTMTGRWGQIRLTGPTSRRSPSRSGTA